MNPDGLEQGQSGDETKHSTRPMAMQFKSFTFLFIGNSNN